MQNRRVLAMEIKISFKKNHTAFFLKFFEKSIATAIVLKNHFFSSCTKVNFFLYNDIDAKFSNFTVD